MQYVVFKYPMPEWITGYASIHVPVGYKVLDLQFQNDILCAWVQHPYGHPCSRRIDYNIIGTGHPFDAGVMDRYEHVKTCQVGLYVWHIYRKLQE